MSANPKTLAKRVTAKKYQGDDHWSWAVFIDNLPFVCGLSKDEIRYYRKRAIDRLINSLTNR